MLKIVKCLNVSKCVNGRCVTDCQDSDASKQTQAKTFKAVKPRILLAVLADFEATESKQFFLVLRAIVGSEVLTTEASQSVVFHGGVCGRLACLFGYSSVPPSPG